MNFDAIFTNAVAAGKAAATAYAAAGNVVPMVVGSPSTPFGTDVDYSKKTYFVADGVCGFAWVHFPKANTAFTKWLKKAGHGHKGYPTGWDVWISDYNQSMQLKDVHAHAMAAYFNSHGYTCYAQSRMD